MKYKPIITKKAIIFHLEKPIYHSFYAIWDKWLKVAKEKNLKMVVYTPLGVATFENVNEYLKGAKKLERFYKNPNEPMIFYGRDLLPDIKKREELKKKEEQERQTKEPILGFEGKAKLLEVYKKIKNKNTT